MADLSAVFADLRAVLAPYAERLDATRDDDTQLYVDTRRQVKGKPVFFGAVQLKKAYVSYHLMPVYEDPELLADVSDGLRARMQGKSCFNFKVADPDLLAELATLTEAGWASYRVRGLVDD